MTLPFIIAYISIASVIVPIGFAIIQWRRLSIELVILSWVLFISLTTDLASFVLLQLWKTVNTHPLINVYLLIQFLLLFYMYSREFSKKLMFKIIVGLFIIFSAVNLLFFQSMFVFNTNTNALASLILIVTTLVYFHKLIKELPILHIHRLPMLWIAFSVLTYYSGTLFIFLASNYFFQSTSESARMMWILHNLLNITKNILFAIGLWQSYRSMKSVISSSSVP